MKVILMHGKDSNPSEKWYPWLIRELEKKNIEIIAPTLPKTNDPVMEEWLEELNKAKPDENTILVGHSRGGGAILKWLEKCNKDLKVKKVILVAAISGLNDDIVIPEETNFGFYDEKGYDYEKIKKHCDKFVVFHSEDDPWVPYRAGERSAKGLNAKFYKYKDKKHFGIATTPEFPELLEEIIK